MAIEEENDNDPNCTFQPKINDLSKSLYSKIPNKNFHERNDLWSLQKMKTPNPKPLLGFLIFEIHEENYRDFLLQWIKKLSSVKVTRYLYRKTE